MLVYAMNVLYQAFLTSNSFLVRYHVLAFVRDRLKRKVMIANSSKLQKKAMQKHGLWCFAKTLFQTEKNKNIYWLRLNFPQIEHMLKYWLKLADNVAMSSQRM